MKDYANADLINITNFCLRPNDSDTDRMSQELNAEAKETLNSLVSKESQAYGSFEFLCYVNVNAASFNVCVLLENTDIKLLRICCTFNEVGDNFSEVRVASICDALNGETIETTTTIKDIAKMVDTVCSSGILEDFLRDRDDNSDENDNDDLVDRIEDSFNENKWDLSDSGTYLDNVQDEVDERLDDADYPDSFDIREDYEGDDGYFDMVDSFRDAFEEIANELRQNDSIDWNDDDAVDELIANAIDDNDDRWHELEDEAVDDAASRIVDDVLSHWDDDDEEDDDNEE